MVLTTHTNFNACPECNGLVSLQKEGDLTCVCCGLVITEKEIDVSNEGVRIYDKKDESKSTHGPFLNPFLPIQCYSKFKNKTNYNPRLTYQMYRMNKENNKLSSKEKSLITAIKIASIICSGLQLSEYVKSQSIYYFVEYKKKRKRLTGFSVPSMVAACVYLSCRMQKDPTAYKEIIEAIPVSEKKKKEMFRCYKTLVKEFRLKVPPFEVSSYIVKLLSKLNSSQKGKIKVNLDHSVATLSIAFFRYLSNQPDICFNSKNPVIISAGIVHAVLKFLEIKISLRTLSKITKTSPNVISYRSKEFANYLNLFNKKDS